MDTEKLKTDLTFTSTLEMLTKTKLEHDADLKDLWLISKLEGYLIEHLFISDFITTCKDSSTLRMWNEICYKMLENTAINMPKIKLIQDRIIKNIKKLEDL